MTLNIENYLDLPAPGDVRLIIRNPNGSIVRHLSPARVSSVTARDKIVQVHQASGEQPVQLTFQTCEEALRAVREINSALNTLREADRKATDQADHNISTWVDFRAAALSNSLNTKQWYLIQDTGHGNYSLPEGAGRSYKTVSFDTGAKWCVMHGVQSGKLYRVNVESSAATELCGTYTHQQTSASKKWTINHFLGKRPSVTVQSADGADTHRPRVEYTSANTCTLHFSAATDGVAHLN